MGENNIDFEWKIIESPEATSNTIKAWEEELKALEEKVRGEEGTVNNQDIRDILHVGQSTVSDYLKILVSQGVLKPEGKGKATVYTL